MDHPLTAHESSGDEALWDELSHQHSREIQQHQIRHSSGTAATLQNVWKGTTSTIRNTAASLASAAQSASYRPIPRQDRQSNNNNAYIPPNNLEDFGLQHHDEPLLEETAQATESRGYGGGGGHAGTTSADTDRNEPYVFLKPFQLLPKRDGWGAVANLDLFFTSLYNYYYHRGLMPIVGKGIVELVSLVVTLWLSVFLFAYVDWTSLATCHDETTCRSHFSQYLIQHPFWTLSIWNILVMLYCVLFLCYTAFAVWGFLYTIRDAVDAKIFFEEKLGISQHKLEGGAVDWDIDVVSKIVELQQSGQHRVAIHGQELDALVIAQRILRKENFLVAFFNRRMLDLSVPLPFIQGDFFCKSLEWSIYFCVLNYMFNHKYQIRPAFYLDASSLKRRFVLCGIAHAVFMPFLLFFMTLHFSMQNVYDMKSSKQYLGPREWSLASKWIFREFNELQHVFERRMVPSYEAAETYLELFGKSAIFTALGRILVFIGGSMGAVLIVFAALNDAILLHVKIGDWNLLWYVGLLGVVYSIGQALQPSPKLQSRYTRNIFGEMEVALVQIASHTHHCPEVWKTRPWDQPTRKAVSALFQYKAQLFALEVASVMLAPLILCVSLPKCAEHICEFVLSVKSEVPGAGDVCGFSTFNFDVFGDENWEGRTMGSGPPTEAVGLGGSISASISQTKNVESATRMHAKPRTLLGKTEKSFFNFKSSHPSWKTTQSGQTLLDRVEDYRNRETIAVSRERQHHIEAAARQLETLAQIEQHRREGSGMGGPGGSAFHDSHIEKATGGADSGGGGIGPSSPSVRHQLARDTPPRVSFDRLPREEGEPLPFTRSLSGGMRSPSPANPAALSVLHYADIGLSTELRRILNRSTLEADASVMGSVLGVPYDPTLSTGGPNSSTLVANEIAARDNLAGRQYQWLERYHAHVAGQRPARVPGETPPSIAENTATASSDDAGAADGNRTGGIV